MSENKGKLAGIAGLLILVLLVNCLPWERQSSGITDWLRYQGQEQVQTSEKVTSAVVASAEGAKSFAGTHQINGANWAIPNLLRHWFRLD